MEIIDYSIELLRASHLPEDLLSRREIMLTEEEYFRLMEQAGLMTKGDEVIRIATNEGIETFSPPVFAAYCSSDGRNFLTRLAHYKRLVGHRYGAGENLGTGNQQHHRGADGSGVLG